MVRKNAFFNYFDKNKNAFFDYSHNRLFDIPMTIHCIRIVSL